MTRSASTRRPLGIMGLVLLTAIALSGCTTDESIDSETVRGVAPGVHLTADEELGERPVAVWSGDRATFTVVTWGSSGCPPVPASLTVRSAERLELHFDPPTAEICTADYAPSSHIIVTPDGVGTGAVELDITFEAPAGGEPVEVTVAVRDPL